MAEDTPFPLNQGNNALHAKQHEEAIRFYTQAKDQLPFENSIDFNIILAESRKNKESITKTILKKEMVRYVTEAKTHVKQSITVLIVTADCSSYHIDDAYLAAEVLNELVNHVIISCLKTYKNSSLPLVDCTQKPSPIITIKGDDEVSMLDKLSKKIAPDLVFYCGPPKFIQSVIQRFKGRGIPVVLTESANINPLGEQCTQTSFRKLLVDSYKKDSPYIKIKSILDSALKEREQHKIPPALPAITQQPGKDIVLFWKQNDTGLYGRRPDMIAKYLASRDDIRKVMIIDAPITESELDAKKMGLPLTHDRDIYVKTYEKIFCQLDNEKISHHVFISKTALSHNEAYEKCFKNNFSPYKEYLEKVFREEGITTQNATFWFYPKNYFAADIIETFRPKNLVVDIVDDHRAWPGVPTAEKDSLTRHYRDIASKANICIANCQAVVNSMREFNSNILLLPNGCEEQAEIIEPLDNCAYNEIKEFKGKILGFVGNLESKIDIPLLEKLANKFTDSLIVLVGSTHANPKVRDLQQYPNIKFTGVVEYKYINAIVSRFTVGIVPHLRTSLTENMNPLKVFVYATNRIPIVCSNIDNLPQGDFIHVTKSHEEFIEQCNLILQYTPTVDDSSFTRFIAMNSWRNRLKPLVKQLQALT